MSLAEAESGLREVAVCFGRGDRVCCGSPRPTIEGTAALGFALAELLLFLTKPNLRK